MSDNNTNAFLTKWLDGELSDAEIAKEIGDKDFSRYQQILSEVDQWQPSNDSTVFEPTHITKRKKEAKVRFLGSWQSMSLAASIILMIAFGYLYFKGSETVYETKFGEVSEIKLPDEKSFATLGPNSNLRLRKKTWKKRREMTLEGKAHFDVASGSPFVVNTSNGSVEVLGTKFDVNQIDESLVVTCYEGKVRAKNTSQEAAIIIAGESVIYHNGEWEQKQFTDEKTPSWIQNEVKFLKAPITLVIKELKAIYGIEVDMRNINLQRRFTGSFPTDNLEQSLQIVFGTLGIEYRTEDKKLILSE